VLQLTRLLEFLGCLSSNSLNMQQQLLTKNRYFYSQRNNWILTALHSTSSTSSSLQECRCTGQQQ
jgi:hypothetical protein